MRICKVCRAEKALNQFTSYKNYSTKFRQVCRECENKKIEERRQKFKEKAIKLNEEEREIIRKFNTLKSSKQILSLLVEGYDVSWSGKSTVIFNKANKTVHAKNATKEIYNIIFARYCIELEKKFIKR